jgi:hypothetical protein
MAPSKERRSIGRSRIDQLGVGYWLWYHLRCGKGHHHQASIRCRTLSGKEYSSTGSDGTSLRYHGWWPERVTDEYHVLEEVLPYSLSGILFFRLSVMVWSREGQLAGRDHQPILPSLHSMKRSVPFRVDGRHQLEELRPLRLEKEEGRFPFLNQGGEIRCLSV